MKSLKKKKQIPFLTHQNDETLNTIAEVLKKQAFLYTVGRCSGYQEWDGGNSPSQVPVVRKNMVYRDFTNQNLKLTCLSSCASNFFKNMSNEIFPKKSFVVPNSK